jgi:hypothetical protein
MFVPPRLGVLCGLLLLALGCDARVAQCNKLVEGVKRHTAALSAAIEKLGEIQNNPAVSDEFSATITTAKADIGALELSDEKVAGFAKQYLELLAEADKVNLSMAAAAKANDRVALDRAAAEAEKVVTMEKTIVGAVNEYCQG